MEFIQGVLNQAAIFLGMASPAVLSFYPHTWYKKGDGDPVYQPGGFASPAKLFMNFPSQKLGLIRRQKIGRPRC